MLWRAYCDESTDQKDDGWFVIGGYVATAEEWSRFSLEWNKLLPFLPKYMNGVFKMSVIMGSDYYDERALAFYRLVERSELISMCCTLKKGDLRSAVDQTDWPWDLIKNWDKFRADLINPYYFAMRAIVLKLCEVQHELGINEPVDFIFDERTEQRRIQEMWQLTRESVTEDVKRKLGKEPRFDSEDQLPALQAADMWAWIVRVWQGEQTGENWATTGDPNWPWFYQTSLGKGFRVSFDKADLKTEIASISRRVWEHVSGRGI